MFFESVYGNKRRAKKVTAGYNSAACPFPDVFLRVNKCEFVAFSDNAFIVFIHDCWLSNQTYVAVINAAGL